MILLAAADTLAAGGEVASQLTATVFGMELSSAGGEVYKVLAQLQLAASPATIYTVPGSTTTLVKTITVVNNDSVPRAFSFFRAGTAAANRLTPPISLLPNGMAVYEDGQGWQVFNATGQLLTAYGPFMPLDNWGVAGSLAETLDRNYCPETNTVAPTASGTLFLQAIWIPAGVKVSTISMFSATTAAGTPTHWMFGLFDVARALLATSTDQLTAAWAANTLKSLAMVTPYIIPTSALYYLGIFMVATTIITMKGGPAKTGGQLAGTAPILHGASSTGLTTAMPNPAAAITAGLVSIWGCVS